MQADSDQSLVRAKGSCDDGPSLVEVRNISKAFRRPNADELTVIDDVSFDVADGQFVAVVGPSGCGKTTLLRMIAGMLEPTGGIISLRGGSLDKRRIGFVFQFASLYPWRTVRKNVLFGLELRARGGKRRAVRAQAKKKVDELLELVGLRDFGDYYPGEISGGMQQRTNLARALAISPELLLMDEPFSALDAQTREDLQIELQRIAVEVGSTVIFVTHDIREAVFLADKIIVLGERPSSVLEIVEVPTARPRSFAYEVSDEYNGIVKRTWDLVHRNSSDGP